MADCSATTGWEQIQRVDSKSASKSTVSVRFSVLLLVWFWSQKNVTRMPCLYKRHYITSGNKLYRNPTISRRFSFMRWWSAIRQWIGDWFYWKCDCILSHWMMGSSIITRPPMICLSNTFSCIPARKSLETVNFANRLNLNHVKCNWSPVVTFRKTQNADGQSNFEPMKFWAH